MQRIGSIDAFWSFREMLVKPADSRSACLVITAGTCGQASGANDILRMAKRRILERELREELAIRVTGCQGFCQLEPFIVVEPHGHLYANVRMDDVDRIIDACLAGRVVQDLLYRESPYHQARARKETIPFYARQHRLLLERSDAIDPIRIFAAIAQGSYAGLAKALEKADPDWIIEQVIASGLRGRGGAGFPTGRKWAAARAADASRGHQPGEKYVVCNADEGDPGAYMDRSLLEGNPHAVIEGLALAGLAIGARRGIIYVRSEYPLAIKHTLIALRQGREMGLLGADILGTGFAFDIDVVRGAGAFVCGEETALLRSIEGKPGEPRQRPPYPVEQGLWGQPTSINNVETLANIPVILEMGAEAYAQIGVPGNSGTKIFSLVGKIRNTGLVEVPMGTTIGEIVYDIGGGALSGSAIKAVQTGGPSGGCIPARLFDLPIDYDSLREAGSIMGSGGMIVMDEHSCLVDIAKYYMSFLSDESCGKCFTCRKGTQRMVEILDDVAGGRATMAHLDLLEELAHVVADTSMCGLGQSAPNTVLTMLRYFHDEVVEHIVDKRCRAGVCPDLVGAPCQSACPIGTEAWRYVAHIARGELAEAYAVIRETNPFPSVCARVCDHPCEAGCRMGQTDERPIAIRALKRVVTDTFAASGPSLYEPVRESELRPERVAIVGAGPAGLTAAHHLSLLGYRTVVFEADDRPGGMLLSCIPSYRLPREVIEAEIDGLLDDRVTLRCGVSLGRDITLDGLLDDGYAAVFVAVGAQASRRLKLEGEESEGVYPAVEFLRGFNLKEQALARGRVGVIGGGNSAIDAARVALRQPGVDSVTVLYRRTREEMPAFAEEIDAAIEEGVLLETLVSPSHVRTEGHLLLGLECVRNELGSIDASGRRRPIPIDGSQFGLDLDTLIVAISEQPDQDSVEHGGSGLAWTKSGTLRVDPHTLQTSRDGVFAGGDLVTGPNTVVAAIAAGKRVARVIDRYLRGLDLHPVAEREVPTVFIEPPDPDGPRPAPDRLEPPHDRPRERCRSFDEVEHALSREDAIAEARRCLRCDLDFTRPEGHPTAALASKEGVTA